MAKLLVTKSTGQVTSNIGVFMVKLLVTRNRGKVTSNIGMFIYGKVTSNKFRGKVTGNIGVLIYGKVTSNIRALIYDKITGNKAHREVRLPVTWWRLCNLTIRPCHQ